MSNDNQVEKSKSILRWTLVGFISLMVLIGVFSPQRVSADHLDVYVNVEEGYVWPSGDTPYKGALSAVEHVLKLPPRILYGIAKKESNFIGDIVNCNWNSSAGAKGIMQIIPRYHPDSQPCSPPHAISYAGHYLRELYTRYGSWYYALAAYNWGPNNVDTSIKKKKKLPKSVHRYASEIMAIVLGGLGGRKT